MEREAATLSYLELAGFVRVYQSGESGQMETEVASYGVTSVEDGRIEFGREHNRLLAVGWRCIATDVKTVGDVDGEGKPEPRW